MESLTDGHWNTSDQRLRKTFSLALVIHGLLLIGLSFAMPAGSPPSPSLDITWLSSPLKKHRIKQTLLLRLISWELMTNKQFCSRKTHGSNRQLSSNA